MTTRVTTLCNLVKGAVMNNERYKDSTAERAIGRVAKEEKLKAKIEQMCKAQGYRVKQLKLERVGRHG